MPVSVYSNEEYDKEQEYEVEAIIDERRRGATIQYRVKWKVRFRNSNEFK